MIKLSLGTDHRQRKALPILRVLGYFTAAIAGLARHAVRGNEQHNKGERLHWARGKSMDHDECIVRHSLDVLDYQAWLERNPGHPDRDAVLDMLEHEYDARLWRAAADSQEFYEKYRDAPISPSSKLPAPAVPEGTDYAEKTFDDFMQEFTAPSDPAKLPRIVDGAPGGEPWAIVDCNERLLGTHSSYADAESCLRELLASPPVNTPEELAELEKMQGKIVLVGGPGLVDGGEGRHVDGELVIVPPEFRPDHITSDETHEANLAEHNFPLFKDCPSERGNGVDEAGLERCGAMSRTKRVCTRMGGHAGAHADAVAHWAGVE